MDYLLIFFSSCQLCAGLVLQPASEAEEDEVCGPRQHPLAAALLPRHKKSKFSIPGTAIRGRPGNTFEKTLKFRPTSKKHLRSNWEIESWKKMFDFIFLAVSAADDHRFRTSTKNSFGRKSEWPFQGNTAVNNSRLWSQSETVNR